MRLLVAVTDLIIRNRTIVHDDNREGDRRDSHTERNRASGDLEDDFGNLPLHTAAIHGALISLTACKNTQNAEGDTAIHQPVKSYKTEAISLLAPVTDLNNQLTNRCVQSDSYND